MLAPPLDHQPEQLSLLDAADAARRDLARRHHPAQFSTEVLDALAPLLANLGRPVHDPFAGCGERLGRLCDWLGLPFTGTELEPEFVVDPRVRPGDATDPATYPAGEYAVVTSPAYPNALTDHFAAKDTSRRYFYRFALGQILGHDRPLHVNNMGRYGNRHRRSAKVEARHWQIARDAAAHWPAHVILNAKDVITPNYVVEVVGAWWGILDRLGYRVVARHEVPTPGLRHGANREHRAEFEVILLATREPDDRSREAGRGQALAPPQDDRCDDTAMIP